MFPKKSTFSIIAYDPETDRLAVGGTSHWFAYATLVPFVEPGVGAVANQAECNFEYPGKVFELLKSGDSPEKAVEKVISDDIEKEIRQLIVADTKGNIAAHTGKNCVRFAEHHVGENYAVAGNMLANDKILDGMSKFYEDLCASDELPFVERVIKTLQKGQELGGDFRGKRSAGLLVTSGVVTGKRWEDIEYDLRVDDNPAPLVELERLYKIATAYRYMQEGDNAAYEEKDKETAKTAYEKAYMLFPENSEIRFWYAKMLYDVGMKEKAKEMMDELVKEDERWKEYWERVREVE